MISAVNEIVCGVKAEEHKLDIYILQHFSAIAFLFWLRRTYLQDMFGEIYVLEDRERLFHKVSAT